MARWSAWLSIGQWVKTASGRSASRISRKAAARALSTTAAPSTWPAKIGRALRMAQARFASPIRPPVFGFPAGSPSLR